MMNCSRSTNLADPKTSAVDLTLQPKLAKLKRLMDAALADGRFFDANGYREQLEILAPGEKRWTHRRVGIDWTWKGECRRKIDRREEDRDGRDDD